MKRANKKNLDEVEELSNTEEESDIESNNSELVEDDVEDDIEIDEEEYIENIDNDIVKENDDDNECYYQTVIEDSTPVLINNIVPKEDRITIPYLTKYETVRVLGTRAKQISLGAKILVKDIDLKDNNPIDIAKIELQYGMIPYIIRRPLPNGKIEEWKISELVKKI